MVKRIIYNTRITPLIGAVALFLIHSCQVDERYSSEKIENVDTNLTLFENGLSIPLIEETAKITADSLFNLSGLDTTAFGDYLKVSPDGNYYLEYNEEYDLNKAISELNIKNLIKFDEVTHTYDLSYDIKQDVTISGASTTAYGIDRAVINVDNQLNFTLLSASDIPEMVERIGSITLNETKAILDLKFSNLPNINNSTYRISIQVQLPDCVSPSVLDIEGELDKQGHFNKTFNIEGFDLSSYDLAQMRKDGKSIELQVQLSGKITADNVILSVDDLNNKISGSATITLTGPNKAISIKELDTYLNYCMDSLLRIPFFALTKELKDCTLDLPKADLNLSISSNMAIPADASLDFNKGMYTFPITIPYSEKFSEVITEKNSFEVDLNPLISSQTDTIDVRLSLNTDPDRIAHFETDATYDLKTEVNLELPLKLGDNSSITYSDTLNIEKNADILKEVLKRTSVQLYGNVENTLPFEVAVKLELLSYDPQGDTYTLIPTEKPVESVLAQANSKHNFTLSLKTATDAPLQKLSHLRFSVQMGSNGANLNKDNYISISGEGLTVPEGISLDFNELIENED